MLLKTTHEFFLLENILEAIPRKDNLFPLAGDKYVERQLVYFDKDGTRSYGAYYNILDQFLDKCYWGEGYVSKITTSLKSSIKKYQKSQVRYLETIENFFSFGNV